MDKPSKRFYDEKKMEIKSDGQYGPVWIGYVEAGKVGVYVDDMMGPDQLREAANLFNQLAGELDGKAAP